MVIKADRLYPDGFSMNLKTGARKRMPRSVAQWLREEGRRTRADLQAFSRRPSSGTGLSAKPNTESVQKLRSTPTINLNSATATNEFVIDEDTGRQRSLAWIIGQLQERNLLDRPVLVSQANRKPCQTILRESSLSLITGIRATIATWREGVGWENLYSSDGAITITPLDSAPQAAPITMGELVIDGALGKQGPVNLIDELKRRNLWNQGPVMVSTPGQEPRRLSNLNGANIDGSSAPNDRYVLILDNAPTDGGGIWVFSPELDPITIQAVAQTTRVGSESSEAAAVTEFVIDDDLGTQGAEGVIQRLRELGLFGKMVIVEQPESTTIRSTKPFKLEEFHIGRGNDVLGDDGINLRSSITVWNHVVPSFRTVDGPITIKVVPQE